MRDGENSIIIPLLLVILVALTIILGRTASVGEKEISGDSKAQEWTGEQELEKREVDSGGLIAIPGITELVLREGETTQKVNLHNPESNNCYMVFTLICNEDTIWKSDYCMPGTGFYEIEISYPLVKGKYRGSLLYSCYAMDGTQLNSAKIEFPIYVQ